MQVSVGYSRHASTYLLCPLEEVRAVLLWHNPIEVPQRLQGATRHVARHVEPPVCRVAGVTRMRPLRVGLNARGGSASGTFLFPIPGESITRAGAGFGLSAPRLLHSMLHSIIRTGTLAVASFVIRISCPRASALYTASHTSL